MAGVLYVVATPIGNLEDITLRALRILKEVDSIAAEDTRRTRQLLSHYGIRAALVSYYDAVEAAKAPRLISEMKAGKKIALVSDAGTPLLSDPGLRLVREAVRAGIPVVPIPGASALTAVLSVSGLPIDRFAFEGFLPAAATERRARLTRLREERRTLVFFEAPHRLEQTLKDLGEILGDREAVLAREVSKLHEEFLRGKLSEIERAARARRLKGEITLIVGGAQEQAPAAEALRDEIAALKRSGMRAKEVAELLRRKYACPKREIYRLFLES